MKSTLKYFVVVAIASFVIGLPWVNAQGTGPKYEVVATPICWKTGGTDSNLIRYSLISPSSGQPSELFYINSLGAVINPVGGILKMGWCCNCGGSGGSQQYYPGDGIEIDPQDTVAVDSSVMRYNVNYSTLEDGNTRGYFRMNKAWGNQWSSKPGNRYDYLNILSVTGDTLASFNNRTYARPSVLGGGGYFGWVGRYSAFNGISAQFGVQQYVDNSGHYTGYDRKSVKIEGTQPGGSAYSYRLPAESPTAGYESFPIWLWDSGTSEHVANHVPGLRGVATGTTDVNGDITVSLPGLGMPDATYLISLTPIATTRYPVSAHTISTTSFKINTGAGSGVAVTIHYQIQDL